MPLVPILLGFIAISLAFNATVPLLEAPDEPSHVAFVRYLESRHALPVQQTSRGYFPVGQEGSQPPLYYALGAALLALSPGPALAPTFAAHNPFVTFDRSSAALANRALYAHTPREAFPYRGDVLGIHLVRLLGLFLGAATVLLTFLIAGELFPRPRAVAIIAAAIVAFNPQFDFISGVVNDDSLIATTATLVLWCLIRWSMRGGTTRLAVALGLGLGAALLAKTDGILLIPLAALVLLAGLGASVTPRLVARHALIVAGLAAAVAGWWFARNVTLYGDPLGWQAMLAANGSMLRHPSIDAWSAAQVLWRARGTFWGAFGWTNVLYPGVVYRVLDGAAAACLVGLLLRLGAVWKGSAGKRLAQQVSCLLTLSRQPLMRGRALALLLLVIWPLMVFASLVRWVEVNQAADQWRLLFPAVGPIAVLLAAGVAGWGRGLSLAGPLARRLPSAGPPAIGETPTVPGARLPIFAALVALVGVAIDVGVLSAIIVPAFYPRSTGAVGSAPTGGVRFGDAIELLDYQVSPARLGPAGTVEVDLDWRLRGAPVAVDEAVSLGIVGDGNATLAKVQTWPQQGRAPTTGWQPGRVYHDHYALRPSWSSADPQLASVWLNLYDAAVLGGPSLPVTDGDGKPLGHGIVLGQVKLEPSDRQVPVPAEAVGARLGSSIELVGYDVARDPQRVQVTLYWQDLAAVSQQYTVFVHVAAADGRVVAQNDSPPRGGAYPTTAWEAGETIRDRHTVALAGVPPGTYQVVAGLYVRSTGERLPVRSASGLAVPNNAQPLFDLTVPRSVVGNAGQSE